MSSQIDNNGFKEIHDNPLTKVGVFPYLGKDIPGCPDPTQIYYVYRPESELADPECIESFKLLPWIDDHTVLGDLLPGATPAEQKGVQGVIGERVYFKDGYLRGNLKLFGSSMGTKINSHEKRELSLSYVYMLDPTPGSFMGQDYQYIQRKIRGNHLALVKEGRSGPDVCVQDSMDIFTITLDSLELETMAEENKDEANGDESGNTETSMTLAELIALVKEIAPQVKALTEAMAALNINPATVTPDADAVAADTDVDDDKSKPGVAADAKIKDLQTQLNALKAQKPVSVQDVLATVSARNKLADQLSHFVGTFAHDAMTLTDVAKYGVQKLNIACDSGEELAVLKGYMHSRSTGANFTVTAQDSAAAKTAKSILDEHINAGAN